MWYFIAKRLLWLFPVVIGVSILIFTIMFFTPGDPVRIALGTLATKEQVQDARQAMGLNDPFAKQYYVYMKNLITKGSLGNSYITKMDVMSEIIVRAPYTIKIAMMSLILSVIIGMPLGIIAATNQYTWKDNTAMFASLLLVAIPEFWIALELVLLFSVKLGLLPVVGVSSWKGYILPCLALCIGGAANIARQTRSSMLEVIRQDYIATARAKGLSERAVIIKHALKNALIPIITTIGTLFAGTLGGALIIETIFSIPGMGIYMMGAINSRDYSIIRGCALFVSVWFCICMLIIDILYAIVDPRIRMQFIKKGG